MFCDLMDSTERARRTDLEDWRDLIRQYQSICFREVTRAGGFVAQYLGDGVLTYFGYPIAHEQDAKAAVDAGLAIVRACDVDRREAGLEPLLLRIGIDSGVVLASEMGFGVSRQPLAVGNVPNLAARIQSVAGANAVLVSDATHQLVQGYFDCRDAGLHQLRGLEDETRLHEVIRPREASAVDSRLTLTPLVARLEELRTLLDCWGEVRQGRGRILFISGEAGVGKSRLLRELKGRLTDEPHYRLEIRGSPQRESSALFPVVHFLRGAWGLNATKSSAELRSALTGALGERIRQPHALLFLASILDFPALGIEDDFGGTTQRRKQLTLELLVDLLLDGARRRPTLFIVEDLHWIDPSTRELLDLVSRRIGDAAVMMVSSSRSAETPFPSRATGTGTDLSVTHVQLARLSGPQTEAMIEALAGQVHLAGSLVRDLVEKSDGVPLYVEEVTRMVLADEGRSLEPPLARRREAHSLAELGIPATLRESLIARLDRLGPARTLAQLGAVIGRTFDERVLRVVSALDEGTLSEQLRALVELDILHAPSETSPQRTYVFKHALIQEAAYASLVRSQRRTCHLHIAEFFQRGGDAANADTTPELLAHHWAGAECFEMAIPQLLIAGKRAFERSAYIESARHLQQGLKWLDRISEVDARRKRELELCLALGPVLVSMLGYSNPEVERIYARARELCFEFGNDRLLYAILSGLHLFHQSRAELGICAELAASRMELAQRLADPTLQMHVLETVGTVTFWRGQYQVALAALSDALSRYTPGRGRDIRLMYGTDTRVVCEAYQAQALWYLGHADQARDRALEAVAHARETGDVHSLALALVFSATVHLHRGELESARQLTEEAIAHGKEQHLEQWLGSALFMNGVILVKMGRVGEGLALIAEGGTVYRAVGATVGSRFFAACLGDAFLSAGMAAQGVEALAGLGDALRVGEDTFHDAELARVRGELLLGCHGDTAMITAELEGGLVLARSQGARSLELRCATSLARSWRDGDRGVEARDLLAPIRSALAEGRDTADARAADACLASLPPV
jgi:class 3 adenylate cyclase/tetratricopeptide (TPR) repeat protein